MSVDEHCANLTDVGQPAACDFCAEVDGAGHSYFRLQYPTTPSRLVRETEHFVVWPTMGQFVRGGLLIVSRGHLETMAESGPENDDELRGLISDIQRDGNRQYLVYEHGARRTTGGSCGIYHAHAHLTPSEVRIDPRTVLGDDAISAGSYVDALEQLRSAEQYLLFECGDEAAYVKLNRADVRGSSQFLRRRLSGLIPGAGPWDWRQYSQPEAALLETLRDIGRPVVPL